jgi:hypothetical protein
MTTGIPPISFSADQRQRLVALKLSTKQIAQLESKACPLGKIFLAKPLRMADVRDRVAKIRDELSKGQTSLHGMFNANMTEDRKEALLRFCDATAKLFGYKMIEQAPLRRAKLARIFGAVTAGLPSQSRQRTANPRPVQLIWQALIEAHELPQANPIHLSWSPDSIFRKVVEVCYEAMTGCNDVDCERALKAFVRAQQARERRQREELGIDKELVALGVPAPNAKGRPRKTLATPHKKI